MRTIKDVLEALECCNQEGACNRCPYHTDDSLKNCLVEKNADAIELIQHMDNILVDSAKLMKNLYDQKGDAETRVAQLEREKAAMLEHLRSAAEQGGVCIGCKHADNNEEMTARCYETDFDCESCIDKCPCHSCERSCNYEWRGVAE